MKPAVDLLVRFYDQRAGGENLIKEAKRCRAGGVSAGALADELQSLPVGDAGI
jgi:hypothetical protein